MAAPQQRSGRQSMAIGQAREHNSAGRQLKDLVSVGPATLADLALLGIDSVEHLARCEATALYDGLCQAMGTRVDPCCEDVFAAAIAQARNPELAPEQRLWWYWTRVRKQRTSRTQEPT